MKLIKPNPNKWVSKTLATPHGIAERHYPPKSFEVEDNMASWLIAQHYAIAASPPSPEPSPSQPKGDEKPSPPGLTAAAVEFVKQSTIAELSALDGIGKVTARKLKAIKEPTPKSLEPILTDSQILTLLSTKVD